MNYSIKIMLPDHVDREGIYSAIEKLFNQNNFKVDRYGDKLTFERLTKKNGGGKLQILTELFSGFSIGTVSMEDASQKELICKINYLKHFVISLIVALIICAVFSIYTDDFLKLLLSVGLPFTVVSLFIGIKKGSSQVEALLRKSISLCLGVDF